MKEFIISIKKQVDMLEKAQNQALDRGDLQTVKEISESLYRYYEVIYSYEPSEGCANT